MRFSCIIFLLMVSLTSWLFFVTYFYFIDNREEAKLNNLNYPKKVATEESIQFTATADNNFWFIQITDLHISKFNDNDRSKDLLTFCLEHVRRILPAFIIVSGDLVDAKSKTALYSKQYLEEWTKYQSIILKSNVLNYTKWLDIRGNHDSFNVPNLYHSENFFRSYSVQGRRNIQSYKYVHRTSFGTYSFIGIDACPNPGLKRPYNFFGILSTSTLNLLQYFTREVTKDNMTFWFGHYPTSTIISPGIHLKSLIGQSAYAYLCGHLHTLMKTVPQMYALQSEGFLELELADWRDSRYFRIGVIDHDFFTFLDSNINDWPFILVTNPKDSRFLMPHKESVSKIASSSHIRIFVWSLSDSFTVKVHIDDNYIGIAERVQKNHPLHVLKWTPGLFTEPNHEMRITVEDSTGKVKVLSHNFNVNGKPEWNFKKWPSIVLLSDHSFNLRIIYYTLWHFLLTFIVGCKLLSWRRISFITYQDNPWFIAALRFGANEHLFYPLFVYLLYSVSCPLIITELVDNNWGLVFVYGVYVSNTYIPEASPYLSEIFQNGTFILPLIFILIRSIRYDYIYVSSMKKFFSHQWFYIVIVMWQCTMVTYWTLIPYGFVTTVISPCRLHVVTLSVYLMYATRKTKKLSSHFYNQTDVDQNGFCNSNDSHTSPSPNSRKFFHPDESFANLKLSGSNTNSNNNRHNGSSSGNNE